MNNSTNLNIRIDRNIKETSEKVFEDLGLNMTTAINMFIITFYANIVNMLSLFSLIVSNLIN